MDKIYKFFELIRLIGFFIIGLCAAIFAAAALPTDSSNINLGDIIVYSFAVLLSLVFLMLSTSSTNLRLNVFIVCSVSLIGLGAFIFWINQPIQLNFNEISSFSSDDINRLNEDNRKYRQLGLWGIYIGVAYLGISIIYNYLINRKNNYAKS